MKAQKTFLAYGHRYRIVYTTSTKTKASSAKKMYKNSVIKELTNGRWAIGVKYGKKGY